MWRVAVLWGLVVLASFVAIAVYAKIPGDHDLPPPKWGDFSPAFVDGHWRLVMAVHPQCPCSGASLANLERVLTRHAEHVTIDLYVYRPADTPPEWSATALIERAKRIPSLTVRDDVEGVIARKFGIQTSAGLVLYSPAGEPVFYGGVTPSRGHEGGCEGLSAIEDALEGRPVKVDHFPVYGCPLRNSGA